MQVVWWQREAASAVAAALTRCKSGDGKCLGGSKGNLWLMFAGPDRVGKRKMAMVLAELVCGATTSPVMLCLGSRRRDGDEESEAGFRGKTTLDRIVEAVRRNPFSLILIEDVDEADAVVCGSIKRAMETGRLADSYGREVSLGNVFFILTADWLPDNLSDSRSNSVDEEKLIRAAGGNWQLRLSVCEKTAKRQANWQCDEGRQHTKPRKEMASTLTFDLNLAADANANATKELAVAGDSRNSSDLTVDHEDERALEKRQSRTALSPSRQLLNSVDDVIVFKAVDFSPVRCDISTSIASKFATVIGNAVSIQVEDKALEKILGGVWLGRIGLEEWAEEVLVPSFHQLKAQLPSSAAEAEVVVWLESCGDSGSRRSGDLLPSKISVAVDGLNL